MRYKTLVCLGSGGGYIPRIMTQARVDLYDSGIFEGNRDYNWGDIGSTYIVDAANEVGGEVNWLKKDSFFRENFYPRIINETTEDAYYNFFVKEDIKIDYLHIDAGHTYDDVKLDFELYTKLLSKNGVVSIHDTDIKYADNYIISKDISDINADIGNSLSDLSDNIDHQNTIETLLLEQRNSVSSVSIDEEVADLMQFQRSFQASSRVLNTLDKMLELVVMGLLK